MATKRRRTYVDSEEEKQVLLFEKSQFNNQPTGERLLGRCLRRMPGSLQCHQEDAKEEEITQ